jgi:hypothetical protein
MQVAIRPAKPFTFGVLEDSNTPVFALPGNPVSAMVSFEMFVRPAIRRMAGHHQLYRPVVLAQASHAMPKRSDGKTHFVGVDCYLNRNGRWRVRSVGGPASHQLAAMSRANALAILREAPGVKRWDQLPVMLIEVTGLEAASLDWAEVVDSWARRRSLLGSVVGPPEGKGFLLSLILQRTVASLIATDESITTFGSRSQTAAIFDARTASPMTQFRFSLETRFSRLTKSSGWHA